MNPPGWPQPKWAPAPVLNGTLAGDVSNSLILECRKVKLTVFCMFREFRLVVRFSASVNLRFASPALILCVFVYRSVLACDVLLLETYWCNCIAETDVASNFIDSTCPNHKTSREPTIQPTNQQQNLHTFGNRED